MVIAVCEPGSGAYSETFIRSHIERLQGTIVHIHGGWPLWESQGRRIIPLAYRGAWLMRRKLPSAWSVLAEQRASLAMSRLLRDRGVQVALAEYGPVAVSLLSACRQAGVPLVAQFHGVDAYHRDELGKHRENYQRLFREAAALIAVSRDMVEQLVGLGAPRSMVFCNSCGVDMKMFQPTRPEANPPLFVAAGRFVDKKAPHLTLLAFARVLTTCPDARLTMIGEGPLWNATRQLAAALGIDGRVEFPGRQTHSEVAGWLRRARAFVQHSVVTTYGDSEGTPVGILEAGATGLPVVSTRHAGIKEAVLSGTTGFLVDELDITGMAEAMTTLALDPALAGQMGAQAHRHVGEHYSMDVTIDTLSRILHAAAESRSHAR
jgi:glycosyltransferase involved in cell wall biosynthesis